MTTTKKKSAVRKFTKPDFVNEPLSILYSCRVRLSEDERKQFKEAYKSAAAQESPAALPAIGGSTVTATTAYGSTPVLEAALGISRLVCMDLLNSRDTISLTLIVKLQQVLGVTVFDEERLKTAFDNYVQYVFTQFVEG